MAKSTLNARDYIQPLNMNDLQGRMLQLPASGHSKREILVLYGHHSLLERWWGLVQNFNTYGSVTMPDLPGFGDMDSFYKIGQKPTIDNFADYVASFIKLKYRRKRICIVGISFGFVVATRMLQRYPDIAKKVDLVVCAAGFTHEDDFTFSRSRMLFNRTMSRMLMWRIPAFLWRHIALSPVVLRRAYAHTTNAKHKFAQASALPDKFEAIMDIEIDLWHMNDVRTQFSTINEFLHLDNCKKQTGVPVWHVYTEKDQYFDNKVVEQHLRIIYSSYESAPAKLENHVVSVIADKKETAPFIPWKLRRFLAQQDKQQGKA